MAALFAALVPVSAQADTGEQDRQFLSALESAGWTIKSADGLVTQGRMVCNEGLGHGVSRQEMQGTLASWGYSSRDASTLIDKAIDVYCPQYRSANTGATTSGPTYADGDAFTEQVYARGLLRNLHPSHVVQILANICNHASEGVPVGVVVNSYMDGYGLSQRDATWLINVAMAKCG